MSISVLATNNSEKSTKDKDKEQSEQVTDQATPSEEMVEEEVGSPEVTQTAAPVAKTDSTFSSLTKFNYIFYFIYKYKYENKLGIEEIDQLTTE